MLSKAMSSGLCGGNRLFGLLGDCHMAISAVEGRHKGESCPREHTPHTQHAHPCHAALTHHRTPMQETQLSCISGHFRRLSCTCWRGSHAHTPARLSAPPNTRDDSRIMSSKIYDTSRVDTGEGKYKSQVNKMWKV